MDEYWDNCATWAAPKSAFSAVFNAVFGNPAGVMLERQLSDDHVNGTSVDAGAVPVRIK
jgi:hypothetical protein